MRHKPSGVQVWYDEMVKASPKQTKLIAVLATLGGLLTLGLVFLGYVFLQSPAAVRVPQFEHAHLRMQILVNGKAENFGEAKYQMPYEKSQCSGELAAEPIHFHDNRDQFVHIHWKNITGGQVLKYYGWNNIGGLGNTLGYRFDRAWHVKPVPIYGQMLPELPPGTKLYVFSGDETNFVERSLEDFLHKSLEDFFGTASHIQPEATSWLDIFSAKALAHNGEVHSEAAPHSQKDLKRINNLLGNLVIFVQKDKPANAEVRARFAQLVPLSESACGG